MDKKTILLKNKEEPIDESSLNYREYWYKLDNGINVKKKYMLKKNVDKNAIIKDLEAGATRRDLCIKYNITYPTLRKYIREYETKAEKLLK